MIDMPMFDVSGVIITGRTVDAKVTAHLGQTIWDSHHGYTDHLSPPQLRVSADHTLDHHSVSTGYESASARYGKVINDIAKQLGDHITKQLQDWAAKHGQPDPIPTGLMPSYRPTPNDLPLPADPGLTRVISGRGMMMANFTTWTLETSEPLSVLCDLRDRLKTAGWNVGTPQLDDDSWQYHLRAGDKGRVYEAFEARRDGERVGGEPVQLVIQYSDRMTREEMQPAFELMLADNTTPVTTLMQFSRNMPHNLDERLTDLLIERGNLPVAAELRVIRYLHAQGEAEQVMARLRLAHIAALMETKSRTDEIKKLGREITKNEKWDLPPPTEQELMAFGAQRFAAEQPMTAVVELGEPAVFFQNAEQPDDSIKLMLVGVSVTRSKLPEGLYTLNIFDRSEVGGGGGACSSTPHGSASPWNASTGLGFNANHWHAKAVEIADNRFQVTLTARVDKPRDTEER